MDQFYFAFDYHNFDSTPDQTIIDLCYGCICLRHKGRTCKTIKLWNISLDTFSIEENYCGHQAKPEEATLALSNLSNLKYQGT